MKSPRILISPSKLFRFFRAICGTVAAYGMKVAIVFSSVWDTCIYDNVDGQERKLFFE